MVYSIKDVETLTGIRAHTLRAWEQRYNLVVPRRSKSNVRYYLEEDLRCLTTVAQLNKHGYRISKIVGLTPAERATQLARLSDLHEEVTRQLDVLTLAVVELDAYKFDLIIDTHTEQRGFEETMMEVVYPLLDKLNVLYFTGAVKSVHEAFAAALIRQKILGATDQLAAAGPTDTPSFVLFSSSAGQQELSLLFVQYLLRARGLQVCYLGTGITAQDLGEVCRIREVDYVFTLFSMQYAGPPVAELIGELLENCPETQLLLAGYRAGSFALKNNDRVTNVGGLKGLLAQLEKISMPADRNTAVAK